MSELPEGWTTVRLSDVADWGSGGTPSRKNLAYFGGDIPWIKTGELGQGVIIDTEEKLTALGIKNSSAKIFPKGSVAVAMYGATIGKTAILGIDAATNQACAVGVPNRSVTTTQFLYYYLLSQKQALIEAGKGGAQPNISQSIIKNWPIPVPPLPEQQRIADKLDELLARVDGCRVRLGRVPALVKRLRQAVLAAAVSGRLTADWREENGIEADWPWTTFGEAGAVSGGLTKNAQRSLIESRKPYLRVANVYANRLELDDVAQIGLTEAEFAKTKLEKDDLLIVEGNGSLDQIGRAALWTGEIADCVHQNHIIRWRAFDTVLPSYALFWLLSPQGRASLVEVASSTTGLHTLSISKISAIPLNVPTLPEQHEIVRRIETLFAFADRLAARTAAAQARVEQLTPSLLAKAFRGELVETTAD